MEHFINWLFGVLALPKVGLPAVFLISLVSATLLPMGSEPAVFGYVKLNPEMLWPTIVVATLGNTIGGMIDWWMGYGAKLAVVRLRERRRLHGAGAGAAYRARRNGQPALGAKYFAWMRRYGPATLLLSWLPVIGDPLCTLAGWLRLPWGACLLYMAIGKLLRYLAVTGLLLWVPDSFWSGILAPLRALAG
ncbi:YqaA family protein [Pandoraea sp.]|uniref:YqaA family protein n=1 Tax=Pandoraea sp. TaxID=1883445 RepID=UPI00120811AA|nr:YqaA family protein [Pandoraea sp.]MDE2287042.1 DedA family protein [Burkholderiales bacterium]TAL56056.1 MAG: DedA family protein [Pandoraea sp.]TAM18996.1 MAG: DedA family protein [Pandoraea sp.]